MGLSTHVLDTMHGCPAAGMKVLLYKKIDAERVLLKSITLDQNGRNPEGVLCDQHDFQNGTYELVFGVKDYFLARGVELPEPAFLDWVHLDFGVANSNEHYHVPLLVSPWSYSTYRGS